MIKTKEITIRKATTFEFVSAKFNKVTREAQFKYRVNFENSGELNFVEKLNFPLERDIVIGDDKLIQTALADLHFVLGVSYYKLYCPPDVVVKRKLSAEQASFWTMLYTEGLGEFYFKNKLDPKKFIGFKETQGFVANSWSVKSSAKSLVGVGGGKESVVAMELMKEHGQDVTAFVLEARPSSIVDECIKIMKVPELRVKRVLDPKLFGGLNDVYNGHVPVSAIIAFAGYFSALLYGFGKVVVGNEYSSNFGNINYKGIAVNHQWSKSQVFESAFQKYTRENVSTEVEYFSLLRPFYEIRIAKMFAKYKQYFSVISSCNRNFRIKETAEKKWCGECAKCVFVFTLLSGLLTKKELVGIFGANLYENKELLPTFRDLLGIGTMKPFDCVGTFNETRVAFEMATKKYGNTVIQKTLSSQALSTDEEKNEVMQMQKTELKPPYLLYGVNSILLVGYAREGVESEKFLKKYFPSIIIGIADKKFGDDYLAKQNSYDLAIKTAGMPGRLILIPYTTATNLFFSNVDRKNVIGVTGTKGKSTTAVLIAWIIKKSGRPVQLLGNIGKPMLQALAGPLKEEELVVLELSSYQLEDLQFSPHIAVVTNLFPEHMDYHGDVEKYYQAKKQIITRQGSSDLFVYNSDDARLVEWSRESRAKTMKFVSKLPLNDKEILLLGEHNKRNVRVAVTVARYLGITDSVIAQAIKTFTPLKHRLQFVGEFRGVKFYDDAISTTPESTIQALMTLKKVETIFLGGKDRGYDFYELRKSLKKFGVKNVVLFPDSGEKIVDSLKDFKNILRTSDMKEAVKFAYKFTNPSEICLLSCASPSYSIWKDFEEKGDLFQKEVVRQGK
jgi:UDP-N-acetylmuramoylalanine--D-glutamate ligase